MAVTGADSLLWQAQSFAPMSSGGPLAQRSGTDGIFPGGIPGMLANMLLGKPMQNLATQHGTLMTGLGHDQNMYDAWKQQIATIQQSQGASQVSQINRETYEKFIQNVVGGANVQVAPDTLKAMSGMMATVMPMLAGMDPERVDKLMPGAGSADVMYQRMAQGSRYRVDPNTGRLGQDSSHVAELTKNLFDRMYNKTDEQGNVVRDDEGNAVRDFTKAKGYKAGKLGSIYDEMARRGMIDSGNRDDDEIQVIREMQQDSATSGRVNNMLAGRDVGQMDRATRTKLLDELRASTFQKTTQDADGNTVIQEASGRDIVKGKMGQLDSRRVEQSMTKYMGALSAVRDVFGENTPIEQQFNILNQMSQGGMAQLSPEELESQVRTMHYLSKQGGMSMDKINTMQQNIAVELQNRGLNPVMAAEMTRNNVAMGNAYRAMGGSSIPGWGRMNDEQMMAYDAKLQASAADSSQANRMAAVMRIGDQAGGFAKGSAAEALFNAVKDGKSSYIDPSTGERVSTLNMSDEEVASVISSGGTGMSQSAALASLTQKRANQEYVHKYKTDQYAQNQQGEEGGKLLADVMASEVSDSLQGVIQDDDLRESMADNIGTAMDNALAGMTMAERADPKKRQEILLKAAQQATRTAENPQGIEASKLKGAVIAAAGAIEETSQAEFGTGAMNFYDAHDVKLKDARQKQLDEAKTEGEKAAALTSFGKGDLASRTLEAIYRHKEGEGLGGIIADITGTRLEDIDPAVRESLLRDKDKYMGSRESLSSKTEDLEKAKQDLALEKDPKVRADKAEIVSRLEKDVAKTQREVDDSAKQFKSSLSKIGIEDSDEKQQREAEQGQQLALADKLRKAEEEDKKNSGWFSKKDDAVNAFWKEYRPDLMDGAGRDKAKEGWSATEAVFAGRDDARKDLMAQYDYAQKDISGSQQPPGDMRITLSGNVTVQGNKIDMSSATASVARST